MTKYSIEDTSLIAIGDAIRSKTGIYTIDEEKTITLPASVISKTPNAINETEWDGEMPKEVYRDVIKVYDATEMRAVISFHAPKYSRISLYNAPIYTDADRDKEGVCQSIITSTGTAESLTIGEGFVHPIIGGAITIEFKPYVGAEGFDYLGYYAEITYMDANRYPLGEREYSYIEEVPNTMTPARMAEEINALSVVNIPQEAFYVTGECLYRFSNGGFDWFIDLYGDKITTENITSCNRMFQGSKVESIPFDINMKISPSAGSNMAQIYYDCKNLKTIGKIIGKPDATDSMFFQCHSLRELKEESVAGIDWSYVDTRTSQYSASRNATFQFCKSLRKYPNSFLAHGNPVSNYTYSLYYNLFNNCSSLDEIIDLPLVHRDAVWTSNALGGVAYLCFRIKDFTFETNEDGTPVVINGWSKQTLDFSKTIGYVNKNDESDIYNFNSGITKEKEVKDSATYQALKNDEDWWTKDVNYSRYNHDSAVRTINSLPDLSGGAGGNSIKFKGDSGALTDGGAINTLTAEEIAVATAKGWTITLS